MTPGPGALTKMLNIRSLSVISQHFWRGRGVQALALKPAVCLWSSDDALKPSPLSRRRWFFPGFLPPSLWENRAPELNPAALPFLPRRPEPTPTHGTSCPHQLRVQAPLDEAGSPAGAAAFPGFSRFSRFFSRWFSRFSRWFSRFSRCFARFSCGERDKDLHLPLTPCTANSSCPQPPGILHSPKATEHPRDRAGETPGRNGQREK